MSLRKRFSSYFNKKKIRTIYLIDILFMKDINAIYGFQNGDKIIFQLERLLKNEIRKEILSALNKRILIEVKNSHVDVFSLTIFDELDEEKIMRIKNIIFNKIVTTQFTLKDLKSTIDIDITIGCSKGRDDDLQVFAERALHNAKTNYIHFMYYDAKLYKNNFLNGELLETLQMNIEKNLVEPFLQPIQDNKTGKIYKYEALMRIYDKEGTIIMPQVFIDKSRKYRLFNKLMEILIVKTISYIKKYKINISINLDYNDILNPSIKRLLIKNIKDNDFGKYLTVEILESKKINNYYIVNDFINELKAYNVSIAIDDFGSGFSNYEQILNINTDYIKLDGSLVKKIHKDVYYNLIKSIVQFCKEQDIKIVAEFVSDLKILRYVKALEIDYSQGYYIGKPMKIDEIIGENDER